MARYKHHKGRIELLPMEIKIVNPRTNLTYQYNVQELHFTLPDEPVQRKLRVYFCCTIRSGSEIVNPKTWDDQPLEIDLNNPPPRIAQAIALLKDEIEERQQVRARQMLNISPTPTPTKTNPASVPTPTPLNRSS